LLFLLQMLGLGRECLLLLLLLLVLPHQLL
jgi:hypothetical protein